MYRAYCSECDWISDEFHEEEDDAFADLDRHVQADHAYAWGVREES